MCNNDVATPTIGRALVQKEGVGGVAGDDSLLESSTEHQRKDLIPLR